MRLPIDTSALAFLLVKDAVPVRDDKGQPRADRNGVPQYQLQVVAMAAEEPAEVITVKVAGEPEGLTVGGPVQLVGLTVQPYSLPGRDGQLRSGVSFRVDAVRDGRTLTAARDGQERP